MLVFGLIVELPPRCALFLGTPLFGGGEIRGERGARMVGGDFRWRMGEEKIFREAALVLGDAREALEFFGVDDGEVEASLGAVIEEDGIYDFARAWRQAEGDVGNAEDGARIGEGALDEADSFHGFDGA